MPVAGQQLGAEGHARLDRDGLLGLAVEGLERALAVVDAAEVGVDAAEEGGQAAEVVLLPGLERVVVALGAVEPDAEERPGDPGGEALGIGALGLLVAGDGDEVRRRVVGPEAPVGDQVADDRVVAAALQDRVAEPGDEPAAAEDEERAVLGADEGAGEPLGEVVGGAAVAQEVVEPGLDPPLGADAPRSGGSPPATGPSRSGRARAVA